MDMAAMALPWYSMRSSGRRRTPIFEMMWRIKSFRVKHRAAACRHVEANRLRHLEPQLAGGEDGRNIREPTPEANAPKAPSVVVCESP